MRGANRLFVVLAVILIAAPVLAQGDDDCGGTTTISIPGSDSGTTTLSNNDTWYRIDIPDGASYELDICLSAPTSSCWDTYLSLWDASCSYLDYNDDSSVSCDSGGCPGDWGGSSSTCRSYIEGYVTAEGPVSYYICVEGWSASDVGDYCLEVSGTCTRNSCDENTAIDCYTGTLTGENNGVSLPGTSCWTEYDEVGGSGCIISTETGPESLYLFTNVTGHDQFVDFYMTPVPLTNDLDLFALSGCGPDAWDCSTEYNLAEEMHHYVEDGGGYYIAVDGYDGAVGNYNLDVICESYCDAIATPISCGDNLSGNNSTTGYAFWNGYACSGTVLDGSEIIYELDIDASVDSFTASVSGTTGHRIGVLETYCDNDYSSGCEGFSTTSVNIDPASPGTYYLVVDSSTATEGSYNIGVSCSASPPTYTASPTPSLNCSGYVTVNCGSVYNGNTSTGNSDILYYSCIGYDESGPEKVHRLNLGSSTEDITILMTPPVDQDLDLWILSGCDAGSCIDYSASISDESVYLPGATGLYYIVVDGYRGAMGAYTLSVICGSTPTPVPTSTPTPVPPTPTLPATVTPTLTPSPTPTPDLPLDCSAAPVLNCGQYVFGNTGLSVNRAVYYSCSPLEETGGEDVYEINVPQNMTLHAELAPDYGVNLDLFLLSSCDQSACLAASTQPSGVETIDYPVTAGTYYLVVDGYRKAEGHYNLFWQCPPTPVPTGTPTPYLDCNSAINLTCNVPYSGTTVGWPSNITHYSCGTGEETGPESVHLVQAEPGTLEISLAFSSSDDLDLFLLAACDSDQCLAYSASHTTLETISYPVTTAANFYIVVDGYRGDSGAYTLTAECSTPQTPIPTPTPVPTNTPAPPTPTPDPGQPLPAVDLRGIMLMILVLSALMIVTLRGSKQ